MRLYLILTYLWFVVLLAVWNVISWVWSVRVLRFSRWSIARAALLELRTIGIVLTAFVLALLAMGNPR